MKDIAIKSQRDAEGRPTEFELAFYHAPIGMALVSTTGQWLRVNPAICRLVGYSEEELLGLTFQDITHPDDLDLDLTYVRRLLDGQLPQYAMEKRYLHKAGHLVWVRLSVTLVREDDGTPQYFISQIEDISAQKAAEQSLRQLNDRLEGRIEERTETLKDLNEELSEEIARRTASQTELLLRERAIEHATTGIVITDMRLEDTPLIYVNPAFTRMTGYSFEETVGKNCRFLQGDDENQPALVGLRDALREGRSHRVILRNYRKDGKLFWNELFVSPVRVAGGEVTHFVGIQMDITDRKKLEENIQTSYEKLERANRAKSEFLTNMSHELRTPLNGIIGYSELLKGQFYGALNEKQRSFAQYIEASGQHLLSLINDLLDVAKIDSGKMVLEDMVVPVAALLRSALSLVEPMAEKKKIKIDSSLPPEDAAVRGDEQRCRQILLNLLSNAIKFSPPASTIRIAVERDAERPDYLRLTVADEGPGIDADKHGLIFEEFYQVFVPGSSASGGTGIGLALTRRLVELQKGAIGVESAPGEGASFWFTLPAVEREAPDSATGRAESSPQIPDLKGRVILIVDDNRANLILASDLVGMTGAVVRAVQSGELALASIENEQVDLVLMDLKMPGMDGIEVTKRIRALPAGAAIPIVALSASAYDETALKCLASGCDRYLTKPIQSRRLFNLLAELLCAV